MSYAYVTVITVTLKVKLLLSVLQHLFQVLCILSNQQYVIFAEDLISLFA